jgi:hypothetical protein
MAKYFKYEHTNTTETTVGAFFNRNLPLVSDLELEDFLKFSVNDIQNITRIYNKLSKQEKAENETTYKTILKSSKSTLSSKTSLMESFPLNMNTILYLPKGNFQEEFIAISGKDLFLKQKDFLGFWSSKLRNLLLNDGYVKSEDLAQEGRDGLSVEIINENVQVWIWSRAYGKLINVSPFVTSVTTQKSEVGSFNLSLVPVSDLEKVDMSQNEVVNYFNLREEGELKMDFFHRYIQQNDLVFIRFERLQLEGDDEPLYLSETNFEVNGSFLPQGKVWDMMGLVDECSFSGISLSDSGETTITGRDFTKLLIEDASYFMPLRFMQGSANNFFWNGDSDDKFFKRLYLDGAYNYYFAYSLRSIDNTLGFILNQLSNLGVVEDSNLFSQYKNRRTKTYQVTGSEDYFVEEKTVEGIWQIIKLFVDDNLDDRRIADASISYVDGTLMDQFNKLCQKPFVEFYGDTYGDTFEFVVRQPPFTKNMIKGFINKNFEDSLYSDANADLSFQPIGNSIKGMNLLDEVEIRQDINPLIEINEKDIQGYNSLSWENEFYSTYQLTPSNSFIGDDTYIAMSYIPIVYFSRIAEIFGTHRKVVSDNYISFNSLAGESRDRDLETYKSALVSDLKYVVDSTIYLPFTRKGTITLTKGDRRVKKGTFIKLVPTNEIFYVDAVSNSINISNDRIDRSTTLQLSRGMLEKYIKGDVGYNNDGSLITNNNKEPVIFSYFDIVDSDIVYDQILKQTSATEVKSSSGYNSSTVSSVKNQTKVNFDLDDDQFEFFLERKQFNTSKEK